MDIRRLSAGDLTESEVRDLLDFVLANMQCTSPRMNGEHDWRFRTPRELRGSQPIEALRRAHETNIADVNELIERMQANDDIR